MLAPLTALIVDDEPLARQELQFLLEASGGVQVVGLGSNGIEAVDLIRTHKPDVVFLDVRMPGLDGFAVLRKVLTLDRRLRMPEIVFATAFDQYAVRAFEVNAVDYLLKPFDARRLAKTLEKVRARLAPLPDTTPEQATLSAEEETALAHRVAGAEAKLDTLLRLLEEQAASQPPVAPAAARSGKIVVRAGNRLLLVDQRDICFASIDDGEIAVVTRTGEGSSNMRTLDELMDQLDPEQFWRPHRSFLVNLQHIREVVPWFKSSYQLRMDDRKHTEIPVSRMQTRRLRELFSL